MYKQLKAANPIRLTEGLRTKMLSFLIAGLIVFGMVPVALAEQTNASASMPNDIQEHWAGSVISEFIASGLASGYPDGTYRPDNQISRAEFISQANRVFGLTEEVSIDFVDIYPEDWFAGEVRKAVAAGYTSGYPDGTFNPQAGVSRQEAASMLAKIKNLDKSSNQTSSNFTDSSEISEWARGAVNAVFTARIMSGYPDNSFKPGKLLTRAETLVILKAAKTDAGQFSLGDDLTNVGKPGVYGPPVGIDTVQGDVTIAASGVLLQNIVIKGNLLLSEAIGQGEVVLRNVRIEGETNIKGGGSSSIRLDSSVLNSVIISKADVKVYASGNTSVNYVQINSGTFLVQETSNPGFKVVSLSKSIPAGASVQLSGNFPSVDLESPQVRLLIANGTVSNMLIEQTATGSTIDIADGCRVEDMIINSAVAVTGKGAIRKVRINAAGISIEQTPSILENPGKVGVTIGKPADDGSGDNTGGGGGVAPLNLVASDPADRAVGVDVLPTIKLTFDRGVVRDHWDTNQTCVTLRDSSNKTISATVFRADNYLDAAEKENIYLRPDTSLSAGETYTVVISAGLAANNDNTLGREVTVYFRIKD